MDLGAAPGGWTQAADRELGDKLEKERTRGKTRGGTIVAVDLLPLKREVELLAGVHFVQGNFLDPLVQAQVVTLLAETSPKSRGKVDLVLSDMLANVSGNVLRDAANSIDLCEAALAFALDNLRQPSAGKAGAREKKRGPELVMKCLQSSLSPEFQETLKKHFTSVRWEKPSSSRPESREGYWVCGGMKAKAAGGGKAEGVEEEDVSGIYF